MADQGAKLLIVCYDIANEKRRRQMVAALESFGVRVQESVFECWLNADQQRRLEQLLARIIRPEDDSVGWYQLAGELSQVVIIGDRQDKEFSLAIV